MSQFFASAILSLLLVFSTCSVSLAGLECLKTSYGKAKTITANFTQTLTHKDSGTTEKRSGRFFIKRPELVRWETASPFSELLVVNNEAVWNYLIDEEVVYKYRRDLAGDSQNALRFLLGGKDVSSDFYVEDGETAGNYLLFPKEPTANLTEAELWIDENTCVIKRIRVVDFYGNVNDLVFTDVVFNTPVDNKQFNFTPPKGVEVEDNTKK